MIVIVTMFTALFRAGAPLLRNTDPHQHLRKEWLAAEGSPHLGGRTWVFSAQPLPSQSSGEYDRSHRQKVLCDRQPAAAFLQEQVQAKALQELMTQMTDQCFNKCAKTSGERISSSEQGCLAMCMDRYMDTMGVVNSAMVKRSQR
ncbi:unnamed protein product [Scytosiphon promiscuus]